MRETTGAVFDTLAQIHLIRGDHQEAGRSLQRSREAYGDARRWYHWSVRTLEARVALRRSDAAQALTIATEIARAGDAPPAYAMQADLIAVEARLALGRVAEADERLHTAGATLPAAGMSSTWGEFLRLRGRVHALSGRPTEAYHDLGQSVSVFELLGERYRAGLSYRELGKLSGAAGARSRAARYLSDAIGIFESLDATPDVQDTRVALEALPTAATGAFMGASVDGDAAIVRRIVDAAVTPALLAREAATAILEACDGQSAVIFTRARRGGEVVIRAAAGCDADTARAMAAAAARRACRRARRCCSSGREARTRRRSGSPRFRPAGRFRCPASSGSARSAPSSGRDSSCAPRASGRRSRRPARSSDRWSRCCPASCARAPRCNASPIRFSASRGAT